ncbi:hypothetical protein L6452_01460 [Arctium lappa]|uniref:Uncharacterized protein n=1 Tax=Arctium lappa TaxID=4217 RepID=A0ACB9FGY8_ARCLA|nr:hypothetical protein L6452_01460 [Arctium lappa]
MVTSHSNSTLLLSFFNPNPNSTTLFRHQFRTLQFSSIATSNNNNNLQLRPTTISTTVEKSYQERQCGLHLGGTITIEHKTRKACFTPF